jgi:hypothetical protein
MAFEKDYCTKLSKVEYNLDQFVSSSNRSNADSTAPTSVADCLKYIPTEMTTYVNCLRNVSQSRNSSEASNPLLHIISVNEDEEGGVNTTISMPCNSEIGDELGNKWKLVGPYEEVCEENRTFNKVSQRLSNKELWCNKDSSATKKYKDSVSCTVPVYMPNKCCGKDKTLRWSLLLKLRCNIVNG